MNKPLMITQYQSQFQLDQNRELPPRTEIAGAYELRYAFSRSHHRQQSIFPGADYLSFYYKGNQLFFVICDGVSGSFNGFIAAKFLGDKLMEWSKNQSLSSNKANGLSKGFEELLNRYTIEATDLVKSFKLIIDGGDDHQIRMDRRRAQGSQTMVLWGVLDLDLDTGFCLGVGDIRLFLESSTFKESRSNKGDTNSRWSTKDGIIGSTWSEKFLLSSVKSITVYTDGFEQFTTNITNPKDNIHRIQNPNDDVTVLSIKPDKFLLQKPGPQLPTYRLQSNRITFSHINDNQWIRVFGGEKIIDLDSSELELTEKQGFTNHRRLMYQLIGSTVQPSNIELLRLGKEESVSESVQLSSKVYERKRPVINQSTKPEIDPPKSTPPPAPVTEPITPVPHRDYRKYVIAFSWLFGVAGWAIAAILFLQTEQNKIEIQNLSQEIAQQQSIILSQRKTPTATKTTTKTPTQENTATPHPAVVLMECNVVGDELPVYKAPDPNSEALFLLQANHNFSVLQPEENQAGKDWYFIKDESIPFYGWVKVQDLVLSEDCTQK